jgi:hypothetical protein
LVFRAKTTSLAETASASGEASWTFLPAIIRLPLLSFNEDVFELSLMSSSLCTSARHMVVKEKRDKKRENVLIDEREMRCA